MPDQSGAVPFGSRNTDGIVHRRSPFSVAVTVERLTEVVGAAGAKLFAVIDHSGEARRCGTPRSSSLGTRRPAPR